jgi:hypothetical protein
MNVHDFIIYVLEFDVNNPYICFEEETINMLDERNDVH